ncbi:MAG TPA: outer membrane lipoprotein-sorting protein, partial [Lutibacter sp.]|nr:outer membrane lipoprotein-sorting protein [Lutibacter sp.]
MKTMKSLIILAIFILASTGANAQLSGREIVKKAYNLPSGEDQTSQLTMTLINKSGQTRVRKIQQYTKDFGTVEKSIMFFMSPADVKNTSFMNWSYDD